MGNLKDYVGKHGDHEIVEERKLEIAVADNPRLDKIVHAYENWLTAPPTYEDAEESVKPLDYTSHDVHDFSLRLIDYESVTYFESSGLFLSALVNKGSDDDYHIVTEHLETPLNWVGLHNKKNLTVQGNLGGSTGNYMRKGSLTVNGDADFFLGVSMRGGTLRVTGDTGDNMGRFLCGGLIIVEGDTGDYLGENMWGGMLLVKGNAGHHLGGFMFGGSIAIEGDAGPHTGHFMTGGTLTVHGDIAMIAKGWESGKLYHGKDLVRSHKPYYVQLKNACKKTVWRLVNR